MWSFFSRDTSKDFPYEIVDNVAGKDKKLNKLRDKINFSNIFTVLSRFATVINFE